MTDHPEARPMTPEHVETLNNEIANSLYEGPITKRLIEIRDFITLSLASARPAEAPNEHFEMPTSALAAWLQTPLGKRTLGCIVDGHMDGTTLSASMCDALSSLLGTVEKPTDLEREVGEVRLSYRRFKQAVITALGNSEPWAITTLNERSICEMIERLRAARPQTTSGPRDDDQQGETRTRIARLLSDVASRAVIVEQISARPYPTKIAEQDRAVREEREAKDRLAESRAALLSEVDRLLNTTNAPCTCHTRDASGLHIRSCPRFDR